MNKRKHKNGHYINAVGMEYSYADMVSRGYISSLDAKMVPVPRHGMKFDGTCFIESGWKLYPIIKIETFNEGTERRTPRYWYGESETDCFSVLGENERFVTEVEE